MYTYNLNVYAFYVFFQDYGDTCIGNTQRFRKTRHVFVFRMAYK